MPRFFFHTNHPSERGVQDDAGVEYPSVHAAKCEAVRYAGALLCDVAEHFWDDDGLILFTMRVIGTEAPAIRNSSRSE